MIFCYVCYTPDQPILFPSNSSLRCEIKNKHPLNNIWYQFKQKSPLKQPNIAGNNQKRVGRARSGLVQLQEGQEADGVRVAENISAAAAQPVHARRSQHRVRGRHREFCRLFYE